MNLFAYHVPFILSGFLLAVTAGNCLSASDQDVQSGPAARSDDAIEQAVEADLGDAIRIANSDLDVQVDHGIATLFGTVNSVMDRRRAVDIAKRTVGVSAVADQIVVRRSDRTDEAILHDVEKVLRINDSVDHPRITATVKDSVVALLGAVDSPAEKRIAEMAAGGVRGVVDIQSQITVKPRTDRTDREIRDEVAGLLVHSVYLDDVLLDVRVEDAVVRLSGVVGTIQQRDFAERLAEIRGVSAVDVSGLTIDSKKMDPMERERRYADVSDEDINTAVRQLLRADPIVFQTEETIEIAVNRGIVSLNGTTSSLAAKRKAERLASDVIGVARVVNEIEVQPTGKRNSDLDMIRQFQTAVRRSPYLERCEIRAHCQRAHLSIYGIVESNLEKQVAGWLADNVTGVVHVNNKVAVESEWSPKPDDEIKQDLERKLHFTLLTTGDELDVTVEDGVAILRGEVDTWRQWQTAMNLALEAGARHPHNLIDVRYHPPHGGSKVYVGY